MADCAHRILCLGELVIIESIISNISSFPSHSIQNSRYSGGGEWHNFRMIPL